MEFTVTQQQLLSQANELKKLYQSTREQKYKDQENRLRRIVAELDTINLGSDFVPYTGATSDVDLGTHKLTLNRQQFTPQSAPAYSEGLVWYDSDQESLAFYNDSSLSPVFIGENIVLKVYNNTGSTIAKGAAVYIQSGGAFTYPNVALAKADNPATAAVIGLMNASTPTGSFGYVTSAGVITGVNTGAMVEGTVLYLSPYSAGQLMNTVPPTGYVIQVGVVAHSNSPNGTIYTKQTTPLAISAAIVVGTLAINQGGTGATTAASALSNLGGVPSTRTLTINGTTFDLTANRSWTVTAATPTLDQVTTAGNTTTNAITVGGLTAKGTSSSGITPTILLDSNGTNPNEAVDIKLANIVNPKGIRIIASDSLTGIPNGASIQFYNNASANFPGQFYLDSGSHNNAALIFRTAPGSTAITERMRILSNGNVLIGTSTDGGYKLEVNGVIRSSGGDSNNWNTAYGWGNHASAGYLPASAGWSGNIFIPMNLPGQQNITVNNGQITNVS